MESSDRKWKKDDIVGDRDRLLSIGMGAVFLACVVFGALRLVAQITTGHRSPWWGNAIGAVSIALLYLWVRRGAGDRSGVAVHGTALIATVALLVPAAYGMTSSKWWLSLVAFSVLLMGRRREAIVWTILTLVLLPLTAVVEPHIVVEHAIGESSFELALAGFFFLFLLLGVTWAFRRVVEQRAKTLAETARSLERSNLVRSRFLGHMSHELRTPLHGVIAMTDLALKGQASPEVLREVATAQQSARALLELLNNILDVTRADADAIELEDHPFSLRAVLTEVLRPFESRAKAKGIVLRATCAKTIVDGRKGDRVRLGQIVVNLVSNALKFTTTGEIAVEVREGIDADRIVIDVRDSGCGIAPEDLPNIFEPFAQVASSKPANEKGGGLGLAIVRELAQRMEGTVGVTTDLGKGSTFRVKLRLPGDGSTERGPTDLLPPEAQREALDGRADEGAQRVLSVLVCEDDPVGQRVALLMLKRLGHEVTVCEDGLAAWDLLSERHFDLLVTDIEMPELDGVELTKRVRHREETEERKRLPIIATTAHVGEDERHRLLGAGVDVHVPKPFTLAVLTSALERVAAEPVPAETAPDKDRSPSQKSS